MSDLVLIIVRAVHIFAAIIWVGFGLASGLLIAPAARKMGEQGATVFKAWFAYSAYNRIMAIAAVTTTVAGLYLYLTGIEGGWYTKFSQTGSMVLSVGALFGLLAFGHGIALGNLGNKYAKLVQGENPSGEELQALGERIARNGRISGILMIIAVLGMILPRYL
jgi:uncharacterized membrane protein